jgi:hypothetical protein
MCCLTCGVSFEPKQNGRKFCSRKCAGINLGKSRAANYPRHEVKTLDDGTCAIEPSNGGQVLFDAEDAELITPHRWARAKSSRYTEYALTTIRTRSPNTISMHRLLLQPGPGFVVDHINGNGLDNRRVNLRICTHAQNMCNRRKTASASSKWVGVNRIKRTGKWQAKVGKQYLGVFENELDAARAYNAKAIEVFGDFVRLNEVNDGI